MKRGLRRQNLDEWRSLFPAIMKCEICGKKIIFNSGNKWKSVHWDHRHGGTVKIKRSPTSWLASHKRDKKNEAIWKSCDFGMLCRRCNSWLPTKNREEFIKDVLRYINNTGDNND